ncbi:isoleucine patch superfamily enzyme, carbonic anhydrase/acetyltransferase [Desulfitobacterium dehalogenans ATCC 51507]|uniref:Isoleucine patch superfamily enzyme, carbonic anhydrase/acetyltransferase n=1 Tax=Desulfitobacterium dehalogenans (strain ATCC 51507 / DSM 9161 / JW/IU-DC1) TaxID=756499 RepID=I4AAF6_DESDJ|nr:transferase [Desulfitobacterium dehalogenans]AFM00941.1 isoleucine patch superfamily enzyme, carbonic anhydrase/acetyltransferase [Desulfitobacterium dehalogenans ATCC 51507]
MILENSPKTSWNRTSKHPKVHHTAYVHPTAVLIGDVRVCENVMICPNVVLRADEGLTIIIGAGANIQDGVIMHCLKGGSIEIGQGCSIAHCALVHGPALIGRETFVGFRAIVHNAKLGKNSFVSHGAMVLNVELPDDSSVPVGRIIQSEAETRELPAIALQEISFKHEVQQINKELGRGYRERDDEIFAQVAMGAE